MISPQALQAMKSSETQRPVAISALETKQNSHIVETLKDITVKMFETHRRNPDSSEVYVNQSAQDLAEEQGGPSIAFGEEDPDDGTDYRQWYDEDTGETYWTKHKRAAKRKMHLGPMCRRNKAPLSSSVTFAKLLMPKGLESRREENSYVGGVSARAVSGENAHFRLYHGRAAQPKQKEKEKRAMSAKKERLTSNKIWRELTNADHSAPMFYLRRRSIILHLK